MSRIRRQPPMTSSNVPWRSGIAAWRAREQLVPGGEARPADVRCQGKGRLAANSESRLCRASRITSRRSGASRMSARLRRRRIGKPIERRAMTLFALARWRSFWLCSRTVRASAISMATSVAGRALDLDIAAERPVPVPPGFDGEFVTSDPVRKDSRLPAIIAHDLHGRARQSLSSAVRHSSSTPSIS